MNKMGKHSQPRQDLELRSHQNNDNNEQTPRRHISREEGKKKKPQNWLISETSLVVLWLRLSISTAVGASPIPGQGTKSPQAARLINKNM